EGHRTDLDLVAGGQLLLDPAEPAVDQRAVAAAEIAQHRLGVAHAQQAMLAADPVAVEAHVTLVAAAQDVLTGAEHERLARRLAQDDAQMEDHRSIALEASVARRAVPVSCSHRQT